jgi:polyphosphate kinase
MSETKQPYIHRDLSWLDFNYRVLQEAKDPSVPLFERIKFLAIYSNNLDEFFRVRVANHRNLLRVGKKTKSQLYENPREILDKIVSVVNDQQLEFSQIFENQIIPELRQHNIFVKKPNEISEEQLSFIDRYFKDNLLPYVQPVVLIKDKVRPFLNNAALYLSIRLRDKSSKSGKKLNAIVKIPSDHLPRFIKLPSFKQRHEIIILDDVVRYSLQWLFPGYDIVNSYSIKLTRDAELYIDDEYSGDLLTKIKDSLNRRNVGPASRLVYDREIPQKMLDYLIDVFDLDRNDMLQEGRYHNNFDFFSFPNFGMDHLKNTPFPPLPYPQLEEAEDFWAALKEKDHLLHMPYEKYESVIRFFEESAGDPNVTHIKVVQYRVAQKSRIMNALLNAVKAGKQVSVFIEIKARFDEEANLNWGEKLEEAGINVHYSFPGLTVHSKLAIVRRQEEDGPKLYTYLSTGNFHEETAKLYCDYGFFTSDPRITREVARVYSFLETVQIPQKQFQHLLVGQFQLRPGLEKLIDFEINEAKEGRESGMTIKLNSLQDPRMIEKLYEASQAGVKIDLIVRGICSLVPGIAGVSENISVVSIVDRFLEHARIYLFHHRGEEKLFLSSADWMVRNLSYRIETTFPIYDRDIKQEILDILHIQKMDNVKARIIDQDHTNSYRRDKSDLAIRSQYETYYYYKRRLDQYYKSLADEGMETN